MLNPMLPRRSREPLIPERPKRLLRRDWLAQLYATPPPSTPLETQLFTIATIGRHQNSTCARLPSHCDPAQTPLLCGRQLRRRCVCLYVLRQASPFLTNVKFGPDYVKSPQLNRSCAASVPLLGLRSASDGICAPRRLHCCGFRKQVDQALDLRSSSYR